MGQSKLEKSKKILEGKKQHLFQRLQMAYDRSKDLDSEMKLKDFKIKYMGLDDMKEKFEQLVDEWNEINLDINPDFVPEYQETNAFADMFYAVKFTMESINTDPIENSVLQPSKLEGHPRLPKINLLEFDGDPLKWPLFYETFKTLIHENPNLDLVSKVHYLIGKLKRKALSVCAGVIPSAENYFILWDALVEKYEDKRALASIYLAQILEFKTLIHGGISNLSNFMDKIDTSVKSLYQLKIRDLGNFIITNLCLAKLDSQTRLLFERSLDKNEFPSYTQLSEFVKDQIKILGRTSGNTTYKFGIGRPIKPTTVQSFTVSQRETTNRENDCELCKSKVHTVHKCSKFLSWSQLERKKFMLQRSLCFNCLKANHHISSCPSSFRCGICKGKHHSLLHKGKTEVKMVVNSTVDTSDDKETPQVSLISTEESNISKLNYTIILSIAIILVKSMTGRFIRMRVLIDTASQCNFITKKFCLKLGLPIRAKSASVTEIGTSVRSISGETRVQFSSRFEMKHYEMQALVIDKITDSLPSCKIPEEYQRKLSELKLADDTWATPGPIDGLIGAELVARFLGPTKFLKPGLPNVIESTSGAIIIGKVNVPSVEEGLQSYCCTQSLEINDLIERFWTLESIETPKPVAPEEKLCEELFSNTTKREKDGRYVVALPFERFPPNLGNSYHTALKRFLSLEKKFEISSDFKSLYSSVIQDYLDQGHMRFLKSKEIESSALTYYIPHHGVWKPSSNSTPLRVVFDASAKSSNSMFLNDNLYSGPKLQGDIFELLLKFRYFAIAMTADIRQMYRQIKVHSSHQIFQRVLWRFNRTEPVRAYELTTVILDYNHPHF